MVTNCDLFIKSQAMAHVSMCLGVTSTSTVYAQCMYGVSFLVNISSSAGFFSQGALTVALPTIGKDLKKFREIRNAT